MPFRITARTILQLGAELISSDAVAFYELIKNTFDAGSPRADVDIVVRIPHDICQAHLRTAAAESAARTPVGARGEAFVALKEAADLAIDVAAPHAQDLRQALSNTRTWEQFIEVLEQANYIEIVDTGTGMEYRQLTDVYLTIGTRSRLVERKRREESSAGADGEGSRPILGEKGVGRLSAMRLGWRLEVTTATKEESHWNLLTVDWRQFSHDSDAFLEEIVIRPTRGLKKEAGASGTRIRITALKSRWSKQTLEQIALDEFSRFTDPFERRTCYPISLRFNDQTIPIPRFDQVLFENAHAYVQAEFTVGTDSAEFAGEIRYTLRAKDQTFRLDLAELASVTQTDPATLRSLGPFKVWFYWFNRRVLKEIEGIGDKRRVQGLVNRWSGGLMVFRDGFRVKPYGSPDDDWLDLDRKALASAGYKVNRKQIIGKVDITSRRNPSLTDQTNREGLRDCEEKQALISLLKTLLEARFRTFINAVDEEVQSRMSVTFDDIHGRVEAEGRRMNENVQRLLERFPALKSEAALIRPLEESVRTIESLMDEAEELAEKFEKGRSQVIHLAGLGMMVEVVAHELNRATEHTLSTLADADVPSLDAGMSSLLETLQAQLRTLQKRLQILDPLSNSARQVKESFDLIAWVEQILASHEAQFQRHGISSSVVVEPQRPRNGLPVRMVKGMIVQVLENLLSNSVYWLEQQKKLDRSFMPRIEVVVKAKSRELCVTDNGPGIDPARKDEIFQPFVTSKPPGEGKGLGLYIAREIAAYHNAALALSEERTVHKNRLNTFVLTLGVKEE
jgi:signal transduction histidine kinase